MAFFPTEEEGKNFKTIEAIIKWVGLNELVVPAIEKHTGAFADHATQYGTAPTNCDQRSCQNREAHRCRCGTTPHSCRSCANWVGLAHHSSQAERKLGQLGGYRSVRRHRRSGNPSKESGGDAHVKRKEVEDGARSGPGRRIRVHSRGRWTHQQVVPQLCRDNAWSARRGGNTDERTIIGVKRQGGCSTGFSVLGFPCFSHLTLGRPPHHLGRTTRQQLQAVFLFWTAAGFKVAWAKGTRSKVAKWIGLEFTPDFQSQTVTVRIPARTADAFKQDARKLLSAPMIPLKMLRQLAGKGGWIMNLLPKARWTIQRLWGAIAEEERRRSSLAAGNERKRTLGGMRTHLVARRQVEVALRWIVAFWGDQGLSFSRVFGENTTACRIRACFRCVLLGSGGRLDNSQIEHSAAVLSRTFDGGRLCSF